MRRPTQKPSCWCSIPAWLSAPARTRPHACASNARAVGNTQRFAAGLRLRIGYSAIAAARLGAGNVLGVDIDPQAVPLLTMQGVTQVSARFEDSTKDILGQFDIVVANILSIHSRPSRQPSAAMFGLAESWRCQAFWPNRRKSCRGLRAYLALSIASPRDSWVCLACTKDSA